MEKPASNQRQSLLDMRRRQLPSLSKRNRHETAQGIMEFALILPILLTVVYGLLEVGRVIFIYSAVTTASRQAVRYGSATGDVSASKPYPRYQDCAGIRAAAKQVGFGMIGISDANITIQYDQGPSYKDTPFDQCDSSTHKEITLHGDNQDRIVVIVTADYSPIVPLVPLSSFTISSSSARTILDNITISP
jgi:Flp pilus assembly protein TadG